MAGYFYYLGRVFSEKGSWYKILTIVALQALMVYFNSQQTFQGLAQGTDFNLPAILLYILASWLIFGFSLQIYANSLKNGRNVLPDLDFAGMFVSTLRFIPFSIVWAIYMILYAVLIGLLSSTLGAMSLLAVIPAALLFFLIILVMPVIMALHAKNFSYKHVLNPLTPFRIFSRVAAPVALLDLVITLLSLLLYGFIIGGAILIGVSGGLAVPSAETFDPVSAFTIILLLIIFFYVQNVIGFAYSLRLCDIIKSRLSETEYFDDEFDIPADEEDTDNDNAEEY